MIEGPKQIAILAIAASVLLLFFLAVLADFIERRYRRRDLESHRRDLASVTAKFANALPGDMVFVSEGELNAMEGTVRLPHGVSLVQHPRYPNGPPKSPAA